MNQRQPSPTQAAPPTRGKRIAWAVIALLGGIAASLLLLEGLLAFDPVGLRYVRDYSTLSGHLIPAPAGYTYAPGDYRLSRSRVTMRPDGTRLVPDSAPDDAPGPPLVFVGDSVTFGLGVSDDETFVNLIARARPGVRVVNAGMPAFNIGNIRRAAAQQPPDAQIVYLISDNDSDPAFEPAFGGADRLPDLPWIALYWRFLPVVIQASDPAFGNPASDREMYLREVAALVDDPRVTLVGYDTTLTPITPRAIAIPPFTTRLSFADKHPDARGHAELAAGILAVLDSAP